MRSLFLLVLVAACTPYGWMPPQQAAAPAGERHVRMNGAPMTASQMQVLAQLEARGGQRLPDGDYWYDRTSGAAGRWGGPTEGFLPANLDLGGPLPASASGGGNGSLTGVFINGREIHPRDLQGLMQIVGPIQPGRYFVDSMGNAGQEGGPPVINLVQAARAKSGGGGRDNFHSTDTGGGNHAYTGGNDDYHYFFDSKSGCSVVPGEGVSC